MQCLQLRCRQQFANSIDSGEIPWQNVFPLDHLFILFKAIYRSFDDVIRDYVCLNSNLWQHCVEVCAVFFWTKDCRWVCCFFACDLQAFSLHPRRLTYQQFQLPFHAKGCSWSSTQSILRQKPSGASADLPCATCCTRCNAGGVVVCCRFGWQPLCVFSSLVTYSVWWIAPGGI